MGFIPYTLLILTILNIFRYVKIFYDGYLIQNIIVFILASGLFAILSKSPIDVLIISKHDYPLVLTNKRIIKERFSEKEETYRDIHRGCGKGCIHRSH